MENMELNDGQNIGNFNPINQWTQESISTDDPKTSKTWLLENLCNEYKTGFDSLKELTVIIKNCSMGPDSSIQPLLSREELNWIEQEINQIDFNLNQLFKDSANIPTTTFTTTEAIITNDANNYQEYFIYQDEDQSFNYQTTDIYNDHELSLNGQYHLHQMETNSFQPETTLSLPWSTSMMDSTTVTIDNDSNFMDLSYLQDQLDEEFCLNLLNLDDSFEMSNNSIIEINDQSPTNNDDCQQTKLTNSSTTKQKKIKHQNEKKERKSKKSSNESKRIWYKCAWEGCSFGSFYNGVVKRHGHKRHSGKIKIDKSSNSSMMHRFKCDWPDCNVSLVAYHKLVEHKRKHTGEKPFRCKWKTCNYATARLYSMIIHERTHKFDSTKSTTTSFL